MKKVLFLFLCCLCFGDDFSEAKAAVKAKDYEKAGKIYEKNCEENRAWACASLGFLYEKGHLKILNLFESQNKAKELYLKACEGGNVRGCSGLGEMSFKSGNYEKAFEIFSKACSNDDGYACSRLAFLYQKGLGIEASKAKAKEFNQKACNLGNKFSCKFTK